MQDYTRSIEAEHHHLDLCGSVLLLITISLCFIMLDGNFSESCSQQTRDQCYECCAVSGLDEYYSEQCRLKCFRNPEHCIKGKASEPASRPEKAPVAEKPQRTRPVENPAVMSQEEPVRPQPRRAEFVWPNPLNLVPGREFEAASQILILNGIGPRHPNYPTAMRAVEEVLIDFGRNNPAGGALPTGRLEQLVGQFR